MGVVGVAVAWGLEVGSLRGGGGGARERAWWGVGIVCVARSWGRGEKGGERVGVVGGLKVEKEGRGEEGG